jgi:predicted TIM-barrel fold metal-dependent hydrolase
VSTTFVLGFKSHYLGADIPNEFVSTYVRQHAEKMVGLAGIDPTKPKQATEEIHRARGELGLVGIAIAPSAQGFHPSHTNALKVYEAAAEHHLPMFISHGLGMTADSKMEYARPYLLDEIAHQFPGLKIVVSHLGYPWVDEAVALLAKHDNVYADTSGLLGRPWVAYSALVTACQCQVMDRLLFGSDFPYNWPTQCIKNLYGLNHLAHGTNLPTIPREQLRGIVERDTADLLGIETAARAPTHETSLLSDEDS